MLNELDSKKRNIILVLFLIGVFMGSLDMGMVGPLIPSIEQTFQITSRESSWIFTIFVIAFMIGSPVMAKFSDFYGRKKIFILEVLLFGIGSCLVAFSVNIESLLLGRIIQGFGCGGIFPIAGAFIGDAYPIEERGKILGILGGIFGVSAIAGILLVAALLPYGWNLCFIVHIIISIFLIISSWHVLPDEENQRKLKVDYRGIIILTLLSVLLAYGLNQIDSSKFIESLLSANVLPFLLIFIIILPVFIKMEMKTEESIVPVHMLKNSEITIACIETLCYGIIYSSVIFIPSLVIISMGMDVQVASLMMLPILAAKVFATPIVGKLLDITGARKILEVGTLMLAVGLIVIAVYPGNFMIFVLAECLVGVGIVTLVGAPLRYIFLNEVKSDERGAGQAIGDLLSCFGQLLGGALIGGIIASFSGILGYQVSLILAAIVSVIAFLFTFRLKRQNEMNTNP